MCSAVATGTRGPWKETEIKSDWQSVNLLFSGPRVFFLRRLSKLAKLCRVYLSTLSAWGGCNDVFGPICVSDLTWKRGKDVRLMRKCEYFWLWRMIYMKDLATSDIVKIRLVIFNLSRPRQSRRRAVCISCCSQGIFLLLLQRSLRWRWKRSILREYCGVL